MTSNNSTAHEMLQLDLFQTPPAEILKKIMGSKSVSLLLNLNQDQAQNRSQIFSSSIGTDKITWISNKYSKQQEIIAQCEMHSALKLLLTELCDWEYLYVPHLVLNFLREELPKRENDVISSAAIFSTIRDKLVEYTIEFPTQLEFRLGMPNAGGQQTEKVLAENTLKLTPDLPRGLAARNLAQFDSIVLKLANVMGLTGIKRTCFLAGIYLWHGLLDESHRHSQSIEGEGSPKTGDYWHAIMHRMEPDYFNAKYWNRRVGKHPVQDELYDILSSDQHLQAHFITGTPAEKLLSRSSWQADLMVELCEQSARQPESQLMQQIRQIQQIEILLLINYSTK